MKLTASRGTLMWHKGLKRESKTEVLHDPWHQLYFSAVKRHSLSIFISKFNVAKDNDDSNDSTVNITAMSMITLIMIMLIIMIAIMVTTMIMIMIVIMIMLLMTSMTVIMRG